MKTPAIIASLTVVGSIAFGAGQRQFPKPLMLPTTTAPDSHTSPDGFQSKTASNVAGCGDVLSWFANQWHPLTTCGDTSQWGVPWIVYQTSAGTPCDVDGDGGLDYFWMNPVELPLNTTEGYPLCVLQRSRIETIGGTSAERLDCVLSINSEFVASIVPTTALQASITTPAWRDMDSDGDLDAVFGITWQTSTGWSWRYGWFENTGFHHQRVAADLNDDGVVDGADLGILLSVWGEPN